MQAGIKLTAFAIACATIGCGSGSSGGGVPSGTVAGVSSLPGGGGSTPTSVAGTYVGSYATASDQGRALLFVYPNGAVSAWVASTQDPAQRDVFLGTLTPSGGLAVAGLLGSTLQGDLAALHGSWDGAPLQLEKLGPQSATRAYSGTTENETLLVGGLWSGVVDPGGAVTAIFTYPSLGFVSEVLGGQIDPNGSVSFSGPRDVGQGRFENFLAAGRWSARDGSQVGTWHGSMAPTGQPAPRTGGISGAYVGRYQSTSGVTEAGVLGVVIYPDLSFLAVAISTLDPKRKDVGVGLVGPDGVPVGALNWAGSTVTGGSLLRGGTYDAGDHAGTFDLAPATGDRLHSGLFIDSGLSLPGTWIAVDDGQGNVTGLTAYPSLLALGDGGSGVRDANGAVVLTTAAGDRATGRFDGGFSGGEWVSADRSQRGWWVGLRLQ